MHIYIYIYIYIYIILGRHKCTYLFKVTTARKQRRVAEQRQNTHILSREVRLSNTPSGSVAYCMLVRLLHTLVYIYVCICVYVCMYVCMHAYMYVYVRMYVCIPVRMDVLATS